MPKTLPQGNQNSSKTSPSRTIQRRVPDPLRQLIVDNVFGLGKTRAEVAREFSLPWSTVDGIIKKFQDTGVIHAETGGCGQQRQKKLQLEHIIFMCQTFADHPGTTLEEVQQHLLTEYPDIGNVAVSTIYKVLSEEVQIICKRVHAEAVEYNHEDRIAERQEWMREQRLNRTNFNEAIFVDESGFHVQKTRLTGRCHGQGECHRPRRNLSLCLAVSAGGVLGHRIVLGTWTEDKLVHFLQEELFPKLTSKRTILLDRARFHPSLPIKKAIHKAGHQVVYLPPYTPWFNLCEWLFGRIKPYVGRRELKENTQPFGYVVQAIDRVTAQDCQGWQHQVLRSMSVASRGGLLGIEHDGDTAFFKLPATHLWRDELQRQ